MEQNRSVESDDRHLAQAVADLIDELPTERDRQVNHPLLSRRHGQTSSCAGNSDFPLSISIGVLMRARSRLRTIIERGRPTWPFSLESHQFCLPLALSFTFG